MARSVLFEGVRCFLYDCLKTKPNKKQLFPPPPQKSAMDVGAAKMSLADRMKILKDKEEQWKDKGKGAANDSGQFTVAGRMAKRGTAAAAAAYPLISKCNSDNISASSSLLIIVFEFLTLTCIHKRVMNYNVTFHQKFDRPFFSTFVNIVIKYLKCTQRCTPRANK